MITVFDVCRLTGFLGGAALCGRYGWHLFGTIGAVTVGAVGFIMGGIVGQLPLFIAMKVLSRQFDGMTSTALRKRLHDDEFMAPNIILLELKRRQENIANELPFVYSLLTSDEGWKRTAGWAALTSAFPKLIETIPNYNPTESAEVCRQTCAPLRVEVNR